MIKFSSASFVCQASKKGYPWWVNEILFHLTAEEMLQEKTNLFKTSIILARTIAQKINDIGSNIDNQLKNKANISE